MALLVVTATAGGVALARAGDGSGRTTVAQSAPQSAPASDGPGPSVVSGSKGTDCTYLTVTEPVPTDRKPPQPPAKPTATGTVTVTMDTTAGTIVLDLDANAAPCAVNSFLTLASNGFYTGTACHRLSTQDIYVLQCGDPTATGAGGPSYRFADENLPVNVHPPYPRGTVALVNAGLESNGSQFFLVYKDSEISPTYPVFGRISTGLDVLDKVAAAGSDNSLAAGDGRPKMEVAIVKVTVAGSGAPAPVGTTPAGPAPGSVPTPAGGGDNAAVG